MGVGGPLPTSGPRIRLTQVCVRALTLRLPEPQGPNPGTRPQAPNICTPQDPPRLQRAWEQGSCPTLQLPEPPTTTASDTVRVLENCIYGLTTWASAKRGRKASPRTLQLPEILTPGAPATDRTSLRQLHFPGSSPTQRAVGRNLPSHTTIPRTPQDRSVRDLAWGGGAFAPLRFPIHWRVSTARGRGGEECSPSHPKTLLNPQHQGQRPRPGDDYTSQDTQWPQRAGWGGGRSARTRKLPESHAAELGAPPDKGHCAQTTTGPRTLCGLCSGDQKPHPRTTTIPRADCGSCTSVKDRQLPTALATRIPPAGTAIPRAARGWWRVPSKRRPGSDVLPVCRAVVLCAPKRKVTWFSAPVCGFKDALTISNDPPATLCSWFPRVTDFTDRGQSKFYT